MFGTKAAFVQGGLTVIQKKLFTRSSTAIKTYLDAWMRSGLMAVSSLWDATQADGSTGRKGLEA